ncbi:hypothetical protein [Streptomyces sp. I6]|uniref:hypothetical protein n=1 Tax=Streptomyces sp. I6 TaxID=2483113 RepID=UPI00288051CB|nr:hypothetical protein [Streptomyces sp. I6]
MRQRSKARVAPAVVAAVGAVALGAAPAQAAGEPSPYLFGTGARTIKGAESSADAEALEAGTTYRSSIGPGGKLNFRVDLDAERNAYVSVVAVPGQGTGLAYGDGIEVTLQDAQGGRCSSADEKVGPGRFARPMAATAHRTIGGGRSACQEAGAYNVLVERTGNGASSSPDAVASGAWELEIRHVTEPGLKEPGPTGAPTEWPSASPGLPGGGRGRPPAAPVSTTLPRSPRASGAAGWRPGGRTSTASRPTGGSGSSVLPRWGARTPRTSPSSARP